MFEQAREKLNSWWNNPLWAPVTEPLRVIGNAAYAPNKGFIDGIRAGLDDDNCYRESEKNKPKLLRIFSAWGSDNHGAAPFFTNIGAFIAGIAGGIGGGVALGMSGFGVPAIIAGGVAAAALSGVVFPFAVITAVAFGGAAVGAVCSPWAIGKGIVKAVKHHQFQKTQGAVVQATPVLQTAGPDVQEAATQIFSQLRDLPADIQGPVLKSLGEKFAKTGTGASDTIMKAIEAMPDADREALVKSLRTTLASSFDAVATKEAGDSIVLQKDAATMPKLKLKAHAA